MIMNNNNKNKNMVSDYSSYEDSKTKNPANLRLTDWLELESLRCYSEGNVVLSADEKFLDWMSTFLKLNVIGLVAVYYIIVFT